MTIRGHKKAMVVTASRARRVALAVAVPMVWVHSAAGGQGRRSGFDLLPNRVETRHYEVLGTAPPAVLQQLGRDMDFIFGEYDRGFRGLLARSDGSSRSPKTRDSRSERARKQAAPSPSEPENGSADGKRRAKPPKHRLVVFGTRSQFDLWRAEYVPQVRPWANAFYAPALGALVGHLEGGLAKAYPAFFHEGFHQFVHRYVPAMPIWLNEGLAEYYEQARPTGAGWRFPPQESRFRQCAALWRAHRLTPLAQLLTMDQESFYGGQLRGHLAGGQAGQHYSEAYTLVYLMLEDRRSKTLLQEYIRALADDSDGDVRAITSAFFPPAVIARLQAGWISVLARY